MKKSFKNFIALLLAIVMIISILPISAFAANDYTINSTTSTDDYYNLITKKDWDIAPGITESEIVLNNDDGSQRQVLFVMEADLNNEYVKVINSYTGMVPQYGDYKTGVMSEQAKLAEELGYGNVVGAMNTTLSWYTGYASDRVGEPLGFIMLDAEVLFDPANCGYEYGKVGFPSVLVINKDFDENGNPRPADIPKVEMPQITSAADLDGWEDQVIPASSGYIVKDGVNQSKPSHTGGAPRSVVGIKADGTVVIMVNDGRQAPYSEGMSMYELAEVMLDLGCTYAVNCDGGGSTTWLSQRPGEELKVNNSPSDGAERETTTGILFISTAPATGEFVRANISSENDYYTPNSVVEFDAIGTDLVGTEADIPADAIWQLADPSFGTIDNGIFTSNGKQGEVVVQIVYNGAVVGEDTIYIVMPDNIEFAQTNMVIPFGKTVDIVINATYDSKPVVIKVADVDFDLSNNVIGTISGFTFSSAPEGTEVEPAVLSATIGDLTITANISLGKGTEIAYDFENQNLDGWNIVTNYPQYGPAGSKKDENGNYYYNGQNELGYISVVDASTGKVRNGDYALAVEIDFTQIYETGFHSLNMRFPGIDTTDAVSVGFWIYVPHDARFSDMTINTVLGQSFFADGSAMDLCEGWHYVKLDAPGSSDGFKFYGISFSADERASATDKNGKPYYDHINTPNLNGKYTFYIDDISVDYSTAVEDRENPVFSDLMVMDSVGSVNAVVNGQTIKFNNPTFEVKVSDFVADNAMGLNATSAKAYIDGKEVACTFANGKISVNGITLTDGVHTIKFEIYDNAGNSSWVGGSVTVDAGKAPVVSVVPQNPNADRLLVGSLYWLDVKATNIDEVQKIELRFDLNNASYWELEGMNVALGFKAEWSVQADDNIATITLIRTGKTLVTGEAVIASIPVRTWESHITEYEGYEDQSPATLVKRGIIWAQSIEIVLEKGVVTYTDNTVDTFGMKDILVDTELFFTNYTRKNVEGAQAWIDAKKAAGVGFHEHTVVALDDKAATCTEAGYIGRTFCYECNSVVDWGTVVDALGHEYAVVDGKLTCVNCGELFNGVYADGKIYVDGVVADGWNADNTAYYKDGVKLTGSHLIDGVMCTFDENGIYLPDYIYDGWYVVGDTAMFFMSNEYLTGYQKVNSQPYFFDDNGMGYEGEYTIDGKVCVFDNGRFISCEDESVLEAGWFGSPENKNGLHSVEYVVYDNASICITGSGDMMNVAEVGLIPWSAYVQKFIKTIFVAKDITNIGHHSFRNCFFASSVMFEEGSKVTEIGACAFYNMRSLKSIVLPENVKVIGSNAFGQTYNLTEVYLPDGVQTINSRAFVKSNEDLVLKVAEGTIAHKFAVNNGFDVELREKKPVLVATGDCGESLVWSYYANGKLVIDGIGAMDDFANRDAQPWAKYREQITHIEIGKEVTHLGTYAFAYSYNVKSVTFEEGSKLQSIGSFAIFYMYRNLTELVLPESVTTLAGQAIGYNSALVNVYIPQRIKSISSYTFLNSKNVVLNVAEGSYAETFAIKNSIAYDTREYVYSVIDSGFCGTNATWTYYEDGRLVIGGSGSMDDFANRDAQPWAKYREQITHIVIGKDILHLGKYAFAYSYNVKSVTFEEGSKLQSINSFAIFYMYRYLTDIQLPDTVRTIAGQAFGYNNVLVDVYMPQTVTSIATNAFLNSNSVVLNVVEGTYAENFAINNNFAYVTRAYTEMPIAEGTCGTNATWAFYANGKLVIDGIGTMDDFANRDAQPWAVFREQITDIVIGKDITHIGKYAFAYSYNVRSITFEEDSKLESIGALSIYYMHRYLSDIVLPESVKTISGQAFGYNNNLVNVHMSENITSIATNAFLNSKKVVLNVVEGSYAEAFAKDNNIAYEID